jgi:hypothetical protein
MIPLKGLALVALFAMALPSSASAQTVVFQQHGFPTIDSSEVPAATLHAAVGDKATFVDVEELRKGEWLEGTRLLVLPYGSAFPVDAWPAVLRYLHGGGNLLLLGGQPLKVPVSSAGKDSFVAASPQDSYGKVIDFRHSYAVPLDANASHFHWRSGYSFITRLEVKAAKIFAEEGRLQGLGYLDAADGTHLAAPVIYSDHASWSSMPGSRIVALPFTPERGYWASEDGIRIIREAARYAKAGDTSLQIEAKYGTLRPGESPELTIHLHRSKQRASDGIVDLQLLDGERVLDQAAMKLSTTDTEVAIPFHKAMSTGLYSVRATWTPSGADRPQEFAENGFQVEELSALEAGDAFGVHGDFLSLGGKPFLPVGTNYFTTEEDGWDFSGPRNVAVWEHDFADMQRHGVNFVRTGVWMSAAKFIDPATGAANERFLRNLEAYLAVAHRHGIVVNFTFFAFTPKVTETRKADGETSGPTPPNPYLDPATIALEKGYVASVAKRFGKVPWLSYDLINEPSFSNPRQIFHGNVPNGDPVELAAWRGWLQARYGKLASLADAWRTTEDQLGDWSSIALPQQKDLNFDRYGNDHQVRAIDYNLFAQEIFSNWVRGMVAVIRSVGSKQLVNVGQDEGGVTNRLLNQFYATAGVSFTTNHTYWQDDALLWDSVAAKRPGMPNITGETGYQPAWDPDGAWRYDELTGTAIEERKWALGFAAGSSGAVQWDWAREVDFGMQRSDGSAKVWETMMQRLGAFAQQAAPYATGIALPDVAIVLPQSFQLSTHNSEALRAQQTAVSVLFQQNRVEAYAVGENQIETLGRPKLILLPSPYGLTDAAWARIEGRVREGAVLLVSGPFSEDEHLHQTNRMRELGIDAVLAPLQLRNEVLRSPVGDLPLHYDGLSTTILDRVKMADGRDFAEMPLGKGRVLLSALPLELNSNIDSIAKMYEYALQLAGVAHTYTTNVRSTGILICPTRLPHATLYVLTSETEDVQVSFTDERSGKVFSGKLAAGRAALLLVGERGDLVASYEWHAYR